MEHLPCSVKAQIKKAPETRRFQKSYVPKRSDTHQRIAKQQKLLLTLVTSLTQQFAVLLLAHPLAALLDDRTHLKPPFISKVCNLPNVTPF